MNSYRGVTKHRARFQAQFTIGGRQKKIGTYDTPKEAAIMYDRAMLKDNRSTHLLNFPDMVHNLDVEPKQKQVPFRQKGIRKLKSGRYNACIYRNGKSDTIGTFDTEALAVLAYNQEKNKSQTKSVGHFDTLLAAIEKNPH